MIAYEIMDVTHYMVSADELMYRGITVALVTLIIVALYSWVVHMSVGKMMRQNEYFDGLSAEEQETILRWKHR